MLPCTSTTHSHQITLCGYKVKYSEQTIRNKHDITYDTNFYKQLLLNCTQHGMSKMSLSFFKHLGNQRYTIILFDHSTGNTDEFEVFKTLYSSTILQPILLFYLRNNVIMATSYDYFHVSYNFLR